MNYNYNYSRCQDRMKKHGINKIYWNIKIRNEKYRGLTVYLTIFGIFFAKLV